MMSDYTETALANVPKEYFADAREGSEFREYIEKNISSELAERIMRILEYEKEIVVRQSDLRVREFTPTNSVEYRRQIIWSPLVRCKDCVFFRRYGFRLEYAECIKFDFYDTTEDGFCSYGERREDGAERK